MLESIDERYKKNILIATTILFVFIFILILYLSYQNSSNKNINVNDLPIIADVNKNKKKKTKHIIDDVNLESVNVSQTLTNNDNDKKTKVIKDRNINYNLNMKINEIVAGYDTDDNKKDIAVSKNIKNIDINSRDDDNNIQEQQEYKNYYKAQLIALTNKQQAEMFINQTKSKYSVLLKNVKIFISTVNLETKGFFYRVQVGFFRTKLEANNFCDAYLKNSNKNELNCIVVR